MKKLTKTMAALTVSAMAACLLPVTAFAEGSYSVDNTYLVLQQGQTGTITISADNAAGRIDWASEGAVSAEGYAFLDNGEGTITITADAIGTGIITITPTDLTTYDDEVLDNVTTITVEVVGDEGAYEEGPMNADDPEQIPAEANEEEQAQPAAEEESDGILTDGDENYADLTEEDRLFTTVNGERIYVVQFPIWAAEDGTEVWNNEVVNLERLNGFEMETVNYKEVNVDCFHYQDLLRVFVLRNPETNVSGYYVLEDGVGFSPLSYVTVNGKQYIVVDFPDDFQIPEGYQMVEMSLGTNTVHALKKIPDTAPAEETEPETQAEDTEAPADDTADTAAEENAEVPAEEAEGVADEAVASPTDAVVVIDSRTKVMINGYETEISPGLDTADPTDDLYYIYCLVDGKTQLYSYDAGEGTLQRASIVVYHEIPTEPETVIIYETVEAPQDENAVPASTEPAAPASLTGIGWNNMQIQMKVLLIALAVAILLIIILIILFAAMSRRHKKNSKASERRRNARRIPDRDALPLDDEDDGFFSYVKTEKRGQDLRDLK